MTKNNSLHKRIKEITLRLCVKNNILFRRMGPLYHTITLRSFFFYVVYMLFMRFVEHFFFTFVVRKVHSPSEPTIIHKSHTFKFT